MLIIADENIPFSDLLFSSLGTVRKMSGRQMILETIKNADLLMVRSITAVNEQLLAGSKVRFVGTATIGTDHIDQSWLHNQEIGFAAAPGSNAESVAQYIAAALVWASVRLGRPLSKSSLGIIGVGECGGRVERVARALGMQVKLNDPPLARRTGDARYRPLEELYDCDFLTLHVPLTTTSEDPTWNFINATVLNVLKPGAVLINASRGGVVDEGALLEALELGRLGGAIIDTWMNEPAINVNLLKRVLLGTPHIAGYSFDGKVAGARMIYEAACQYMELPITKVELPLPAAAVGRIELDANNRTMDSLLAELVLTAYPVWRDGMDLAFGATSDNEKMGQIFDRQRKYYPLRREFGATQVALKDAPLDWINRVKSLGFVMG